MAFRCGSEKLAARNRAMMTRNDSRMTLASVACPTLIIAGRQDRAVALAEAEELAAGIPRARFVVLDACGHLSSVEQPEAVTRAFRQWLQEPIAINS